MKSLNELLKLIRKNLTNGEVSVPASYDVRKNIVASLLASKKWNCTDMIENQYNKWYMFECEHLSISINDGDDEIFEDVIFAQC